MEAFAWAINHFMHILMGLELVLNLIGQRIFFPFPILCLCLNMFSISNFGASVVARRIL